MRQLFVPALHNGRPIETGLFYGFAGRFAGLAGENNAGAGVVAVKQDLPALALERRTNERLFGDGAARLLRIAGGLLRLRFVRGLLGSFGNDGGSCDGFAGLCFGSFGALLRGRFALCLCGGGCRIGHGRGGFGGLLFGGFCRDGGGGVKLGGSYGGNTSGGGFRRALLLLARLTLLLRSLEGGGIVGIVGGDLNAHVCGRVALLHLDEREHETSGIDAVLCGESLAVGGDGILGKSENVGGFGGVLHGVILLVQNQISALCAMQNQRESAGFARRKACALHRRADFPKASPSPSARCHAPPIDRLRGQWDSLCFRLRAAAVRTHVGRDVSTLRCCYPVRSWGLWSCPGSGPVGCSPCRRSEA